MNFLESNFWLSVVVPIFNEEENILLLYKRLKSVINSYKYEIIFVNDGSHDKSIKIITELTNMDTNIKLINFTRNFGHEAATTAGVEYSKGDAVVIIDADLQDPPELIEDMINLWHQGYEVVYAERQSRAGESFIKKITAKCFYKFMSSISETNLPENTGDFRLIDKKVVEDFRKLKEKNRFFRGLISWIGYNQIGIKFNREKRNGGKTKYNYRKLFKLSLDSITAFSIKPLSFITYLGFLISILSFIAAIVFIFIKIFYKFPVSGWTSLIVTILFVSGFQISLLGIIGEYIGRMFIEIKGRPLYLIKDIIDLEDKNKM